MSIREKPLVFISLLFPADTFTHLTGHV